jgi:hypothetical protein
MKVRFFLTVSSPKTTREEVSEIDPEIIQGMTEQEIEEYLHEYAVDWAQDYIEVD